MTKKTNEEYELPEAPASVTYTIQSQDGFNILFTIRDKTGVGLLEKMGYIEKELLQQGYNPQAPRQYGGGYAKKEVELADYQCPTCGKSVKKGKTKQGKAFEACTNKSYNPQTKTYEGCNYFKYI